MIDTTIFQNSEEKKRNYEKDDNVCPSSYNCTQYFLALKVNGNQGTLKTRKGEDMLDGNDPPAPPILS